MTQRFFLRQRNNTFYGSIDMADDEPVPEGLVEVSSAPGDARQPWDAASNSWGPVALALQDYDNALTGMYQATAESMNYKSWETCSMRAYKPGPFEAECTAFFDWMETCNVKGYAIQEQVTAGQRPQLTIAEFLAEMPPFVRPTDQ